MLIHFDSRQLIDRIRSLAKPDDAVDDEILFDSAALIVEYRRESLDINFVAKSLSISRRTLERHFRQYLGLSVGRAVVLLRLEMAKEILSETDLSMTAVSVEVGFSSPSRMSNVFRRELDCTPREFRQRQRLEASRHRETTSRQSEPDLYPVIVEYAHFWGTNAADPSRIVAPGEVYSEMVEPFRQNDAPDQANSP
ncbi:MAG: helix-turn-helix domain-containing protein [Planctomycetota bacterium]|nr:helix-turn-helix domain-containing protein [Planctomycetota bacterium]